MKQTAVMVFLFMFLTYSALPVISFAETKGEALFMKHCALCHTGGGNIVNPQKTLHAKDMQKNKVKTAEDIIRVMRKPGPGMTPFDEKTISQKEAKEIAEYILKKFK